MRRALGITVVMVGFLLVGDLAGQQRDSTAAAAGEVKVIEVTAKKYEYTPAEIHVKRGTRVQLRVRATDRTHGFKINLYRAGVPESGAPGLRLDQPQDTWRLEKDHERVIEFVAERAGNYSFKCSVFCGFGHRGMTGTLIAEE